MALPAAPSAAISAAISAAVAAACLPTLLAYNLSPSPTYLNQALAFALWAVFALASAPRQPGRGPWALWAALGTLALAVVWSWGPGALPASLALSALATLFAAAVLAAAGAGARARPDAETLFIAFAWAWVACGSLNIAIALVQVFVPAWPDGEWLAASGIPGRAVGNLRQPNHLSSLLLWHCIAVLALLELGRLRRTWAAVLLALGVFAVVLTASRTGLVSVLLLAGWGLADRRLSRTARLLLLAAPLVYAASWLGMAQWATLTQHAFGGAQRLAEADVGGSRVAIWRDALTLIGQQPWAGVGFGEFNLAWTLTPLPQRPVAFFDHTHNLPLQLAVELGLPLASGVMALLLWALWRGLRAAWATPGGLGTAQRCAMVMVLMIGLHSLLEYPLWYSYFLLPAAWAWGFALQADGGARRAASASAAAAPVAAPAAGRSRLLVAAAAVVLAGAVFSVADYLRVAAIFSNTLSTAPLAQRVASGQRSVFFAHHADYAAVTAGLPVADPARAFDRVVHYLLDARLMMAWADSLAERGEVEAARHIAGRLREFRKGDASDFFAMCASPAAAEVGAAANATNPGSAPAAAPPYQCAPPATALGWRSFVHP